MIEKLLFYLPVVSLTVEKCSPISDLLANCPRVHFLNKVLNKNSPPLLPILFLCTWGGFILNLYRSLLFRVENCPWPATQPLFVIIVYIFFFLFFSTYIYVHIYIYIPYFHEIVILQRCASAHSATQPSQISLFPICFNVSKRYKKKNTQPFFTLAPNGTLNHSYLIVSEGNFLPDERGPHRCGIS